MGITNHLHYFCLFWIQNVVLSLVSIYRVRIRGSGGWKGPQEFILSKPLSYGEEAAKTQRGLSRVTDRQARAAVDARPGGGAWQDESWGKHPPPHPTPHAGS